MTAEELQDGIRKNIRALSVTTTEISISVMDCDLENSKKMADYLIGQSNGLKEMILKAEKRGINLSR
jgi:gas vesicle protein